MFTLATILHIALVAGIGTLALGSYISQWWTGDTCAIAHWFYHRTWEKWFVQSWLLVIIIGYFVLVRQLPAEHLFLATHWLICQLIVVVLLCALAQLQRWFFVK